jgi:hypothetical protein
MPKIFENIDKAFDFFRRRKIAYQRTFTSPAGNEVLIDLAEFCRANETTFNSDPRLHAALEGRREVWLRIQQHLNLTPSELTQLATGKSPRLSLEGITNG